MVLKIITVISMLVLSACAALNTSQSHPSVPLEGNEGPLAVNKEEVAVKTEIDPDVLFLLMTAEIAGQRGQYALALDGYLRASKRVKDKGVIERAAKIALFLQDESRLQQVVAMWFELEPESVEAHYLMAIAALKLGDKELAFNSFDFILSRGATDFESHTLLVFKSLKQKSEIELAYQVFEELSVKYPNNAQVFFIQALLDMQGQRNQRAQVKVDKALSLEPKWVKALLLQAQIYIVQGRLADATEFLQRASDEGAQSKVREQIAQLLIRQRRFDEAEAVLQALIAESPENKELELKLALVYLQIDKEKEAKVILERLVGEPAYQNQAAFYLGRVEAKARRNNEALIWFGFVDKEPYKYEAELSVVLLLMDEQRLDDALLKNQKMQSEYLKRKTELVLIESEIYSLKREYLKAYDVLTSVLLQEPENKKALYARALSAEKLDKLKVLEDDLKYILEKDPNDVTALNALGYTLADRTERYQEAKEYLDKAIAMKPNNPTIIDSYGWLLFKLNKYDEAYKFLKSAYDLEPQAEIASHLTEVLWKLGRHDEAKDILLNALKVNPEEEVLLELKVRLLGR